MCKVYLTAISRIFALFIICLMPIKVLAWGANTHYGVTKVAVEKDAGGGGASNLYFFLKTFGFEGILKVKGGLLGELLEICSIDEQFLAKVNTDANKLDFGGYIEECTAFNLIAAGAVLEDTCPLENCRSRHHFFDPVNKQGWTGEGKLGTGQIARDWAFNGNGNDFTWQSALGYYQKAITGMDPIDRAIGQQRLFATLGYVVHLVEDMSQPAHTRDDTHMTKFGIGDVNHLEKYGTEHLTYHYLTQSSRLRSAVDAEPSVDYPKFEEYFNQLAGFSNQQFFSDSTIFEAYPHPRGIREPSDCVSLGNEANPNGDTSCEVEEKSKNVQVTPDVSVAAVNVPGVSVNDVGGIDVIRSVTLPTTPRLAKRYKGFMGIGEYAFNQEHEGVKEDNALILIPKAVSHARGLVNHFFRGKFELKVDKDNPNQLQVKNLSQGSNAFEGGFELFYKTEGGKVLPIDSSGFSMSVGVGESKSMPSDVQAFLGEKRQQSCPDDKDNCPRKDSCVIAYFKGKIGEEEGVAAAQTSIPGNMSVLLVFDTSGSMDGEIGNARNAGLDLLTSLEKGKNNRVSIHSFSDSVASAEFTDDIQAAKASIPSGVGGSTALYDAMVAAGNVASGEAKAHPENKVVVVLYTDGGENASGSSHEDAVSALYSQTSEIDKVLLVFGGSYGSATQQLQDIASQAGQESSTISSFDELGTEFSRAMGGCQDDKENGG